MNSIGFSPKNEFEEILASKKTERKEKLEKLKQRIKEQYIEIATILAFVENETLENPNITYEELMNKIKFSEKISNENIKLIIDGIKSFFKDRKIAQDRYEKYKNNYDLMFEELFLVENIKPDGEVKLDVYGGCLVITFFKTEDFIKIGGGTISSGGYYNQNKNIIVINNGLMSNFKNTLLHEYQHYINWKIFNLRKVETNLIEYKFKLEEDNIDIDELFIDIFGVIDRFGKKNAYIDIKDEILARLKGKSSNNDVILNVLSEKSSYLSELVNIDLQSNYGINFLSYVKKIKKRYPKIYIYLALLAKSDKDLKLFVSRVPILKKRIMKTQLKLSNLLLNDKVQAGFFLIVLLWNLYMLFLGLTK